MVKCCKDCQNKQVNCHSQCQIYKDQKDAHDKKRKQILKAKHQEDVIGSVQYHSRKKGKR